MHHPTDRITHTTAFVTPVVEHWLEREIVQWVHPMKDRSDDPSHHERNLLPDGWRGAISGETLRRYDDCDCNGELTWILCLTGVLEQVTWGRLIRILASGQVGRLL